MTPAIVFFLDVDNTLLDNDRIIADLHRHLDKEFGASSADHYWVALEKLRAELGYVDYIAALQRYRAEVDYSGTRDHRMLLMSSFLVDYPFADRLYPGALQVIDHLGTLGRTVILSDGDVVFQPRKIQRSGLWNAVDGRVLIYIHKEQMLEQVQRFYPSSHYVMVDDKVRILAAMKAIMGDRLVTVFARQGHYAEDVATLANYPAADHTIEHINDLLAFDVRKLLGTAMKEKT